MTKIELESDVDTGVKTGSCCWCRGSVINLSILSAFQNIDRKNISLKLCCVPYAWFPPLILVKVFPVGYSWNRVRKLGKCARKGIHHNPGVTLPVAKALWGKDSRDSRRK